MALRILFVLVAGVGMMFVSPAVSAQSPIVVSAASAQVKFPRSMRFAVEATSSSEIKVLRLTVWQRGVALGSRYSPSFVPAKHVTAEFDWNFQSFGPGGYLPPGTRGEFTWHVEDAAGNTYDTPRQPFLVQDLTQQWQTLSNSSLRVNWHSGDGNFGAAIFQRAVIAREFMARDLGISNIDPLEIYIYANRDDFFNALPAFSAEWTGGRMFPEYGVIMINFPPENLVWGLRATSHELSHAILHSKIRGLLGELSMPHWLDEGLAVYNETDNHDPDVQFEESFQTALRRNTLIPLRTMQLRFPNDSDQAQLAYGESYSVVKFIIEEYGKEKFSALLGIYQNGAQPDDGLVQVYGMNQNELENAWRQKMGAPLREFSSSLLPTPAPRPTYDFSSALASPTAPTGAADSPTQSSEPTPVALIATPPPDTSIPAQSPSVPNIGQCGSGILALAGITALSIYVRRNRPGTRS